MGLLEVFRRVAPAGPSEESQTRASCVLRTSTEPAEADGPTGAPAARGAARAEPDVGVDFMPDMLYDGRRIRAPTIIDEGNRESLAIAVGISLPSRRVVQVLEELVTVHGRPVAVRVDNGPEFLAQPFIDWAAAHRVAIHYIQPGKPDQNAFIERFNRSYRTEVLNAHLFDSTTELQAVTDAWLRTYNCERPHDSLGRKPPLTFLPRPSSAVQSPNELPA